MRRVKSTEAQYNMFEEKRKLLARYTYKDTGKPVIGIGFDKSDAILGLLKSGALKAAMAQNPFTMGYLGVAQAYAALNNLCGSITNFFGTPASNSP